MIDICNRVTGKKILRFDFDSILGHCCEMMVGYVQIPVVCCESTFARHDEIHGDINFDIFAYDFNKSSRFGRLQRITCSVVEKNLYIRFTCR